jgi:eukaryotic-like serine/threonine-protein kinase
MPLPPGTRLGPYALLSQIGAGGMGEVYRARDTRLDRSVAIKVLAPALASDPELRERFEREARAISSLRHPHICTLFDIGEEDAIRFLVLELLEGETLADRLARGGALPVADAIRIALQVCDALDKAHRSGIVHRDLKPGNVFLERTGGSSAPSAKLLDFGLAKTASPVHPAMSPALPTTPATLTAQGSILGTFQYMAPEQVEGLEADQRSDIFAFGALLFEMLTGRPPFSGRTRAALLGAILKDDPPQTAAINPSVPKSLDRIIGTCLAKDPDDRWQSARDLAHALHLASVATATTTAVAPPRSALMLRLAWVLVGLMTLAAVAAAVTVWRLRTPASTARIVFTLPPPPDHSFRTPVGPGTGDAIQAALSPDARNVVFVAEGLQGNQLWLRPIDNPEARALPGTDGASFPFWSPDGRFIGFFAAGKLMKVNVAGGRPVEVCAAVTGRGGTWNRDNTIVFAPSLTAGLQRVSAARSTPVDISPLDRNYGETSHRFPWFLPDGRHFVYTAVVGTCCPAIKPARIKIGALDTSETETLPLQAESAVAYASGHLLFSRDGALMAQPFDPSTRSLGGEPFLVADGVSSEGSRYASFSPSQTGTVVFSGGARPPGQLTWLDRTGHLMQAVGGTATYNSHFSGSFAVSPDDSMVAAAITEGGQANIHLIDSATGDRKKVTFEPSTDTSLVWSPDGQRLVFQGVRDGKGVLVQLTISSLHEEALLSWTAGTNYRPTDWSSDAQDILYNFGPGNGGSTDIGTISVKDRKLRPYLQSPVQENNATFSPDGKWVAYELWEGGRPQVFVRRFPATDEKHQVSVDGGAVPRWSRNGKELFFLTTAGDLAMTAVDVEPGTEFNAGPPHRLFPIRIAGATGVPRQYGVSRDAKRFLFVVPQQTQVVPLTVVVNWVSQPK